MTLMLYLRGSRASDKEIILKMGFLQVLQPGDNVVADRGLKSRTF